MLIALVSVFHVLVSHYAVGGGLFLAYETQYAHRSKSKHYLDYLKQHAWFFILITVVYGAITGVGIWWTIGLASPLATEALIHIFVFGWAIEWVFFVIEIVSAFIFYYFWSKLEPEIHIRIGWIYAGAAWISLVLITGITAFMLHSGSWPENRTFWAAFLNPQFLPQTLARTGGSLLLASLYVFLHASFKVKDDKLRNLIGKRSVKPALCGSLLTAIGAGLWFVFLPESARLALASASVLNVLTAVIFALTTAVFIMMYVGPYRNPSWISPGFAILFLAFGFGAVATGEFIREAVRKPYIVYNVVMSNQVYADEIPALQRDGYLQSGTWTRAFVAANYPQMMNDGRIDNSRLLDLPERDQVKLGEVLFQYHCNDCHAGAAGYMAMGTLLHGWTPDMIRHMIDNLHIIRFFMPPWCGTAQEAALLTRYLSQIAPEQPAGMYYGKE